MELVSLETIMSRHNKDFARAVELAAERDDIATRVRNEQIEIDTMASSYMERLQITLEDTRHALRNLPEGTYKTPDFSVDVGNEDIVFKYKCPRKTLEPMEFHFSKSSSHAWFEYSSLQVNKRAEDAIIYGFGWTITGLGPMAGCAVGMLSTPAGIVVGAAGIVSMVAGSLYNKTMNKRLYAEMKRSGFGYFPNLSSEQRAFHLEKAMLLPQTIKHLAEEYNSKLYADFGRYQQQKQSMDALLES